MQTAQGGLVVDRVSKRFGSTVALDGIGFAVAPGELFGFVGANGAGKTTTMRIVLGVLEPDAGTVSFDGRPVDARVRASFGYLPEERGLYPKDTVAGQLAYFARLHGLSRGEAATAADRWSERVGLGARRADPVEKLSLGNQQRVQLALALVHSPVALVLDEPFSGLDPLAVDTLAEILREQADAGVPVVFSSHQLDLVERLCDRIGIVTGGRMTAVGTVAQLQAGHRRRVLVDVPGAPAGWLDGVPGARLAGTEDGGVVVELDDDADDQHLLRAALALGPVHGFSPRRRTVTEIYREVVG